MNCLYSMYLVCRTLTIATLMYLIRLDMHLHFLLRLLQKIIVAENY